MSDSSDIEYWRGRVDTKLDTLETKVDKNTTTLEMLPDKIEERLKSVINGAAKPVRGNPQSEGQPVTWKDVVDKGWPIVVAIGMLLLGYLLSGQF